MGKVKVEASSPPATAKKCRPAKAKSVKKCDAAPAAKTSGKTATPRKPRSRKGEEPFPEFRAPSSEAAFSAALLLAECHGDREPGPPRPILDLLVRTILSQNTTDKTSQVAFDRLKEGLPTWAAVLDARDGVAEDLVRCGGLAEIKMARIRDILRDPRVFNDNMPSLEWLRASGDADVKATLSSFPGVGPKTVSCVMLFAMGRAIFPVDTHVLHIAKRLRWLPDAATREQAYEHLDRRVPNDIKYALHCLLVEHGKCCPACAKGGRLSKRECALTGPCPLLGIHRDS